MSSARKLEPSEAFASLIILDFLSDLFTDSGRETFSRDDILVILNWAKNDPDLFDPDVVLAYELATADIEKEGL